MCLEWGWGLTLEETGAQAGAARTGHCRRIHRSAPGWLPGASAAAPTLLFLPLITCGWAQARSKSSLQPSGPAHWEPGTVTAWPGASSGLQWKS